MSNSVLFSRKIKCLHCGKNFKGKLQRGKRVYLCSTYDNYGTCKRMVLKEDFLVELLQRRFGDDYDISKENIQESVEKIEVKENYLFTIHLKEGIPIEFEENYIQF